MTPWRRLLDIFGLSALAIAYPVLDLLSQNPEFFTARNSAIIQVISVVFILCVIVPAPIAAVELVAAKINASAGTFAHHAVLAALVTALVMPWLTRVDGMPTAFGAPLAVSVGVAVAAAYHRTGAMQLFVTALSPAIIVVPLWFFINADVRGALIPTDEAYETAVVEAAPPIVFVVFDELPLNSLLDENYEIDSGRYPSFADLAADGYWFRNASTVSSQTTWAVPAIVSGSYPFERGAVPTRRYYPNNLFTLLSERYEMTVFGRFLQLCPASACTYDLAVPRETVGRLLSDAAIVWLHIVLPAPLAQKLPPIVGDWSGFAGARWRGAPDGATQPNDRKAEFERFLGSITSDQARLYFLHTLLPHMPFEYVPSGRRYNAPDYQGREVGGKRLFEAASTTFTDGLHQRHLLQVGFVDGLIGRLVARLRELEIYDDALIVITADHGASYQEGVPRRVLTDDNLADIALVPLFVKVPGQPEGVTSDDDVQTIDILPTIADALSFELPFAVDGRSMLDLDRPARAVKTFVRRDLTSVRVERLNDPASRSRVSLERKIERFGTRTNERLFGVGPAAELLRLPLSELEVIAQSGTRLESSNFDAFDAVDRTVAALPLYVQGAVETTENQPAALAIVLNGVIVATTETYRDSGSWVFASMVPEASLREGANELGVLAIQSREGRTVLASVN